MAPGTLIYLKWNSLTKVNGSKPLTIVTKGAILCRSGFLDPPLLVMQKGFPIVSGGAVKENWQESCLITNIASEFLNYVLTVPFILLHLLGSVLIFSFLLCSYLKETYNSSINSRSYFLCTFPYNPIATDQSKSRIRHRFVQKPEGRKTFLRWASQFTFYLFF